MPLPMPSNSPQPSTSTAAAYPVKTKQAAGLVEGIQTDVTSVYFSDKIMVTITQDGRLGQWIHVPLESNNLSVASPAFPASSTEDDLLPLSHLTPKTLLGGSNTERETIGQLFATQIATAITAKDPQENRTVVLGLGLNKLEAERAVFYDTMELVMKCL